MSKPKNYSKNRKAQQQADLALAQELGMPKAAELWQRFRVGAHQPNNFWRLVRDFLVFARGLRQPSWSHRTWVNKVRQAVEQGTTMEPQFGTGPLVSTVVVDRR